MTAYTSTNYHKHTSNNPLQRGLIGHFHQTAATLLADVPGERYLDVGCGEGFAMRALFASAADCAITGVDLELPAVQLARQANPQSRFAVSSLLALPFPDDSFDVTLCMEVLEHLATPEQGLAELRRVTRHFLLLSVPNEPLFRGANFLRGKNLSRWGNDVGHLQNWSARAFVSFVSRQCEVLTWRTSFPWTLVLCKLD